MQGNNGSGHSNGNGHHRGNGARRRLIVVGNGMVGFKFLEALTERGGAEHFAITVFGEEPLPAYDRVHLTSYFSGKTADDLLLAGREWYTERDCALRTGEPVLAIDREAKIIKTGIADHPYDILVLATGSSAFVPPLEGVDKKGVYVYRTLADLDAIAEWALLNKDVGVVGGGLLGLEAAKAMLDRDCRVTVLECAPHLMGRQVDPAGGRLLKEKIEALGVAIRTGIQLEKIVGNGRIEGVQLAGGEIAPLKMLVLSAGIRPRDELARACGLDVGPRGGIVVNDALRTSDPAIFAVGECALHNNMIYGLVAPGYAMAQAAADTIMGAAAAFSGADFSTKLKLMGVDVANIGTLPPPGVQTRDIVFDDPVAGVYKRLVLDASGKNLLAAVLVGDTSAYGTLMQIYRGAMPLPASPASLLVGEAAACGSSTGELPDAAQICSCNNVCKGQIVAAIREGELENLGQVKKATKACTGCGACVPQVTGILNAELEAAGRGVKRSLCEHFAHTRRELFQIAKIKKIRSFEHLIAECGQGSGCEICKPTAASIFASLWNENILTHQTLQDTNDRFLANIQRQGTYSVVPRVPGGEITPDKLIALGRVAKKYELYCKITGGQRVDLFGARVDQLPGIWEELIAAGFESGHAYGKAVRTVKSCVGSTWCRFGVADSIAFSIRVENRYKGIRSPHKLKSAVSGCLRECAEARCKDFGYIATEKGWNLYVCGNGGINPRHAQLFASDLSDDEAIRLTDRFLMYYIHTADRLTRTADWLEQLSGGLDALKQILIENSLGICGQLEADMEALVATYACEWAAVVNDPAKRALFRHFANADEPDATIRFEPARDQHQPAPWPARDDPGFVLPPHDALDLGGTQWRRMASVGDVPVEGGISVKYGNVQLALFHFASRNAWFASQNMCPHKRDMVLARGILGDHAGEPKVACPQHKKTFSLKDGRCHTDPEFRILTFPVRVEEGDVYLELPDAEKLEAVLNGLEPECAGAGCAALACAGGG